MRLKGKAGFYPTVTCKEAFFSGLHAKHRGLTILSVHEITLDALRTPEGEAQGYASTRVVAVEDDGRTLIVSRFLTGMPRERSQP